MRVPAVLVIAVTLCTAGYARADDGGGDSDSNVESDGLLGPHPDGDATPAEVITGRIADLQAGNIDAVMCTYAVDATVIMAGSVITGRPAIRSAFLSFFGLLGNTVPTFTSQTYSGPMALVTYTVNSTNVVVPDGADSFVIKNGRIRYHTVSATIQFH